MLACMCAKHASIVPNRFADSRSYGHLDAVLIATEGRRGRRLRAVLIWLSLGFSGSLSSLVSPCKVIVRPGPESADAICLSDARACQ